jgi:hypothetical protein
VDGIICRKRLTRKRREMASNQVVDYKPKAGIMYGLTHTLDGQPIVREPKVLKVGIGCLKGPAIEVFIREGKWTIRVGYKKPDIKSYSFESREKAEIAYPAYRKAAPECPYPRKLDYFTFSRQTSDGSLEPDFDAIERGGEKPGSIDVVFFDDAPLEASYSYWSTSELRCKGDGINAERVCSMAATVEEKKLAEAATAAGSKHFPIIGGCYTQGCPYAQEMQKGDKIISAPCKPHGDLKFQLAKCLRVGGTAYFHTTGMKSISQLFSCLYRFKTLTGGGDYSRGFLAGIPFQMVLRPFRTKHAGQPGTAYGVSLEFRAETVDALVKNMIEQGMSFRRTMLMPAQAEPLKMLAAREEEPDVAADEEDEGKTAEVLAAEFDGLEVSEEDSEELPFGTRAQQQEVLAGRLQQAGVTAEQAAEWADIDPEPQPPTEAEMAATTKAAVQQEQEPGQLSTGRKPVFGRRK